MKNPSVTIRRPEGCALGGVIMVFSLLFLIPTITAPPEEKIYGWLIVGFVWVGSLIVTWVKGARLVIDENGVYIKGMFDERLVRWRDIIELGIARVHNKSGASHPEIYITVKGGTHRLVAGEMWKARNLRSGVTLEYRKKIWDCILYYYGQPDFDEWGKPPTVS